jgi:hypothetical protein
VPKEIPRRRESSAAPASGAAPRAPMTALVLLPQTRAVGPILTLAVPSGADRVTFELRLESNDFPRYQVALNDPGSNRTVWRSGPITAPSPDHPPILSVVVPTRALKPQHYSLALIAGSGGDAEVVGSYTFRVERH